MVFIWGTLAHTGIDLLQKLITSDGMVVAYTPNPLLTRVLPAWIYEVQKDKINDKSKFVKNQDMKNPNVKPDKELHADVLKNMLKIYIGMFSRDCKETDGTTKNKRCVITENLFIDERYKIFKEILPDSQHILINRNIADVMKSYKASGWLGDYVYMKRMCELWKRNQDVPEGIFKLDYDNLDLPALEEYLSIKIKFFPNHKFEEKELTIAEQEIIKDYV